MIPRSARRRGEAVAAAGMSWRDAALLAGRGVVRRLGRAALTILAVALAAALLTALVTIARTAQTEVLRQLAKGGPLASIKVAAARPDPAQIGDDDADPGAPRDLDTAAVDRIGRLPHVESVVPVVSSRMVVVPPEQPAGGAGPRAAPSPSRGPSPGRGAGEEVPSYFFDTVVGADMDRAGQLPIGLLAGRLPTPGSLTEVAVTQGYFERLGLPFRKRGAVIGTELQMGPARVFSDLGDQPFRALWTRRLITGVVAQEAGPGGFVAPIEQTRRAQAWSAASDDAGAALDVPSSPYSGLVVVAEDLAHIGEVRNAITAVGYSTSAPENLIASVQRYLRVVEIVLSAVGAIAVVIASIGIANAMLAAVRERRREIGVLKAIGARDKDVLRVFLVEAAVFGLAGGVLGTLAGWLVARAVGAVVNRYLAAEGLLGVSLSLNGAVLAGGIAGATLLALAAGALPALRAARLPAREAVGEG